jgi:cytochrome c oxidase assembly factor CtaG
MSPDAHSALEQFVIRFSLVSVLVLVALVYLRGWFQLRTSSLKSISGWQLGVFLCGVISIMSAVNPPLAALDHRMLSMHMVQHLLLMTIGPPLILLGNPFLSFRRGFPSSFVPFVLNRFLRWAPTGWLESLLTNLLFCWLIATAVLIGWHLPKAFELAMQSDSWHAIECASFLAAGVLFWMPVIRPLPSKARSPQWSIPVYLFLATFPCDALSAFLTFCGRVVYPHYLHQQRPLNFSALQDQEAAGALMWVFVTFVYLIPAVVVTIQILSPSGVYDRQEPSNDVDEADGVAVRTSPLISAELA